MMQRDSKQQRSTEGAATLEFAIVFPVFIVFFIWVFEVGYNAYVSTALDNSIHNTVRELMTNQDFAADEDPQVAHDAIKDAICECMYVSDCTDNLRVSLTPSTDVDFDVAFTDSVCRDEVAELDPKYEPTIIRGSCSISSDTVSTEIMIVRACMIVDPFFPAVSDMIWNIGDGNGVSIQTYNAFVNEPCG